MEQKTTKRFTYVDFGNLVKAVIDGTREVSSLTEQEKADLIKKANAILDREANRADYVAKNPEKTKHKAKGPSPETLALADKLYGVLSIASKPVTIHDFRTSLKMTAEELSPLRVANAMKFIKGVQRVENVKREVTDSKGLTSQRLYTGYIIVDDDTTDDDVDE